LTFINDRRNKQALYSKLKHIFSTENPSNSPRAGWNVDGIRNFVLPKIQPTIHATLVSKMNAKRQKLKNKDIKSPQKEI
jgi:hypothetical protein